MITSTAQRGYYPVYLFREDFTSLYLTLNQGITEVKNRYHGGADTGERFPIFSSARSVCDAFAFSTYVSESIAYEALRTYLTKPGADPAKLLEQARFTKTELIIAPVVRAYLA